MREFDEIDLEILRLLVTDARRPYSDIADRVDLSPPAVSDRIERLQEAGVIERFTVDLDRTVLDGGIEVVADLTTEPEATDRVARHLSEIGDVERVFRTADAHVIAVATVSGGSVRETIAAAVDTDDIEEFTVRLLEDESWTPSVGGQEFAIGCDECGNTVTSEGVSATVDGELHHFCCESCRSQFEQRYERIEEGV